MNETFYSPLAKFLKITPDGQVPDHGWTTFLGSSVKGVRMVVSLLWHGPDEIDVNESLIRPTGEVQFLRTSTLPPEEILMLLYAHHLITNDFRMTGPFTHISPQAHSAWLAENGITFPYDHVHFKNPCLASADELMDGLLGLLNPTAPEKFGAPAVPSAKMSMSAPDAWKTIQQMAHGATTTPKKPNKVVLSIDEAAGERTYLDLTQDKPHDGRTLRFFSKRLPNGNIEGLFVGVDLRTGVESEVTRVVATPGDLTILLQKIGQDAFKNGEQWTLYEVK